MPGFLVHVGATIFCPNFGTVSITSDNDRVRVSGQAVALFTDDYKIDGCGFTVPPGVLQPCVKIRWLTPSARIRVMGKPVVLSGALGFCLSAQEAPQGAPTIAATQTRVKGL